MYLFIYVCMYLFIYVFMYFFMYLFIYLCVYQEKLYVSAGSGHHQVLSFDSLKVILYNSLDSVLMSIFQHQNPSWSIVSLYWV